MPTHAIVRLPGPDLVNGLTSASLGAPSWELALEQHRRYREALQSCGLKLTVLETAPGYPDCCFVEDTAVLTEKGAILTRPGAPSRLGEVDSMRPVLEEHFTLRTIEAPGTLEGGDILRMGNHFLLGVTARTNREGATQLAAHLYRMGYTSEMVPVDAYLHLKTAVGRVAENTVLVTEKLAGIPALEPYRRLVVPEEEAYAANSIRIGDTILTPAGHPRARALLEGLAPRIVELEMSEFQKVDGGLTCLSLLF